jgi:hypothetical protein
VRNWHAAETSIGLQQATCSVMLNSLTVEIVAVMQVPVQSVVGSTSSVSPMKSPKMDLLVLKREISR